MKDLYPIFLFAALILWQPLFAQRTPGANVLAKEGTHRLLDGFPAARGMADTIGPPSFTEECSFEPAIFSIDGEWGAVTGMNGFGDLQKAQRFTYDPAPTVRITGTLVYFGDAIAVGNGTLKLNIYAVDPGGAPGAYLGSSDTIQVSDIVIDQEFILPTPINFSEPVEVPAGNQFFVSVDFSRLYNSRDTVSVVSTIDNCGSGTDTYDQYANLDWVTLADSWNGLSADLWIQPILDVEAVTSLREGQRPENLNVFNVFPNPSSGKLWVNYRLVKKGRLLVEIFHGNGQRIWQDRLGERGAGEHREQLDLGQLPDGNYLLVLSEADSEVRLSSTITIRK